MLIKIGIVSIIFILYLHYVYSNPIRITSLEVDNVALKSFVQTLRDTLRSFSNSISYIYNHAINGIRTINIKGLVKQFNDALNLNCEYFQERRRIVCWKQRYIWLGG